MKDSQIKNKTLPLNNPADPKALNKLKNQLGIIIAVLAFLLYAQSIRHDYTMDDRAVIVENKVTTQGISGIPTILTTDYWYGFQDPLRGRIYRPTSLIVFAVVWQFFPDNPHLYHLINVLTYAMTCLILFILLCRLFKKHNLIFPFVCAVMFTAHPIHTEVVNNIKSLDEMLSFLFGIISILLILKHISDNSISALIFGTISFFLSLASKETGISFLVVIPLVIYFFADTSLKRNLYLTALLFTLTGIYLILRMNILMDIHQSTKITAFVLNNTLHGAPDFISRQATAFYILLRYVGLLILPHPLSCDYNFAQIKIQNLNDPAAVIGIVLYAAMLIYSIISFRKKSTISFGILFFLITLAPVSNIFFLHGSTMAERFLYGPSLGFCVVFTYLILRLTKTESLKSRFQDLYHFFSLNSRLFFVVLSILILYSLKTVSRNMDWKNDITIYSRDVLVSNNSATANGVLGNSLYQAVKDSPDKKNQLDTFLIAKHYLKRSLEIYPDFKIPLSTLGVIYYIEGKYDSAYYCYQKMENEKNKEDAALNYNYGSTLEKLNKYEKALEKYDIAIALKPDYFEAYINRGNVFSKVDKYDRAIEDYSKAIELKPDIGLAYNNRGMAYSSSEKYEEAIKDYNKAIQLKPDYFQAYINLGNVFYHKKRYEEAIRNYSKTIELKADYAIAYYNRGMAEYFLGKVDAACTDLKQAANLGYKPAVDDFSKICK